jgi:2-C-methyl-D-erythritol 4-phosphate cytidylyltransferase
LIRAALITAGGKGLRMGGAQPKQYELLGEHAILTWSILAFLERDMVDELVVTVPEGDQDLCGRTFIPKGPIEKPITVVAGGKTRQESVWRGLKRLEHTDFVAIHDAARPLISARVIKETFLAAQARGAAIAATRVRDTVKRDLKGRLETIPREDLWLAHTPQTFRTPLIIEAHELALESGWVATDDASLVERLGNEVVLVQDEETNIKITVKQDLWMAERFLEDKTGIGQ